MTSPVEISTRRRAAHAAMRTQKLASEGVSVFMLPSDLPVSLSSRDISILRASFARQGRNSLWCGFSLLGEKRDDTTGETCGASRAVVFTYGTREPYYSVMRWIDGTYALADTDGKVLHQANDLASLLLVFRINPPTLH